jgi:hypothetical protein
MYAGPGVAGCFNIGNYFHFSGATHSGAGLAISERRLTKALGFPTMVQSYLNIYKE